jgi:hypothetical protein
MKLVLFASLFLATPFAFAVGDMPQQLSSAEASKYFSQYQAEAAEIGCSGWMASGGETTGGGLPGYQVQTISLNIIQSKSPERSILKITRTSDDNTKTSSLSFECRH